MSGVMKKLPSPLVAWFKERRWKPLTFQSATWNAYASGASGLVHAPTGQGKTLAVWLGPVMQCAHEDGLRIVWITPLRSLASDTVRQLQEALDQMGLKRTVEARTGDTSSYIRTRQKAKPPFALVTTPESLSLMLTDPGRVSQLSSLRAVIVDEWHEQMGSKRGVQTELCLARLRHLQPTIQTWGASASIGNLEEAMRVLLGTGADVGKLIHGEDTKRIEVQTLLPREMDTFPWSGHLGTRMVNEVIKRIDNAASTLLFTNTRSQTEIWFQELLEARPEWQDQMAMHHGSIDRDERRLTEGRLRDGTLKVVVCTSSLDLGVDFSPVEQVMQVGSPKGIARLLQRAGRSGHQPGAVSRVFGVPTNALELVEFAAAREALKARRIEARKPVMKPMDLLVQHLVTIALGGGFHADAMLPEVRSTHAYASLSDAEWQWALTFITTGGALKAYPQYRKVSVDESGLHQLSDPSLARTHKMNIGTIVADAAVSIRMKNGRRLGSVEEWFISGIKPGKCFIFGGRTWQLVRVYGLIATVQVPERKKEHGEIPSWQGGKSPLSTELAAAVSDQLLRFRLGHDTPGPEMKKVSPVLEVQMRWSQVPSPDEILIEQMETRDGHHVYLYPFGGRLVNGALGTLIGYRLARTNPFTVQVTPNDYGVELHTRERVELGPEEWRELLSPDSLIEDLLASINAAELGRHHFREIARVAGLIVSGTPGSPPSTRHVQASSGLLYDVFARYDPGNLLLVQAQSEVLERQLEFSRLEATMHAMTKRQIVHENCARLTPMAFPLWAARISSRVSTEDNTMVLARMLAELEAAAH